MHVSNPGYVVYAVLLFCYVRQYGGYKLPFVIVGGSVLVFALPCTLLVWQLSKL